MNPSSRLEAALLLPLPLLLLTLVGSGRAIVSPVTTMQSGKPQGREGGTGGCNISHGGVLVKGYNLRVRLYEGAMVLH